MSAARQLGRFILSAEKKESRKPLKKTLGNYTVDIIVAGQLGSFILLAWK